MIEVETDFIIIGSGAAGALLANRLSADPRHRVLLVEAGGADLNPLIKVPMAAGVLYHWPGVNWGYETTPQNGLAGRSIVWPRGRVRGGSTAINGMMHIRGNARDYDDWRQLGLAGWSYDDVLPAFRRFERNASHRNAYHGADGELYTEKARGDHPLYRAWLDAARAAGFPDNADFNGAAQEGVGLYDFNIRNGRRVTAANAFLDPIRGRANLDVWLNTQALRLTFEGRRCTGVLVRRGSREIRIAVRRETLVCGGAVNSPLLLMRSGLGDAQALQALGIAPILNRPEIGRNLQDHLGVYVQHACLKPVTLYGLMRPDRALAAGFRAWAFGSGPAASVPLEAGGFLRTRPTLDAPDVHVTFVPGLSLAATQRGQMQHGFLTNVYQLRPQSRGSIRLASSDPRDKPIIDPNYLSAEEDRRCLRDGVRLARAIAEQAPLTPWRGDELAPGRAVESDSEIDDWVRANANTIFHPVGTCRMGGDDHAVLDAALRVRGVAALRVVDASAMPRIISGNTAAPTMMIAEKAAALILAPAQEASAVVSDAPAPAATACTA
ncbi:MAG: choline dehydrogenase [Hyphomonadaceae bacterium]|nr:choline dehydrogenase [Hyphomonadaceae bacterium]